MVMNATYVPPTPDEVFDCVGYASWLANVDDLCQGVYGLGEDEAEDWPSFDAWAAGASPAQAVNIWYSIQGGSLWSSAMRGVR
jgi:hypothetical protein